MKMKILLADDHQVMREGLRDYVQNMEHLNVIGEAENGSTAVKKARQLSPDLVIMDVGMPGLNGIDATREIITENPNIKVIGLSMHSDKRFVLDMLKAGASAYLIKDEISDELTPALNAVRSDELFVSSKIKNVEIDAYIQKTRENANNQKIATPSAKPIEGSKVLGSVLDEMEITKVRSQKAIKELEDSEERLRALFEFAPDAYYLNDLKGRFIDANKRAEELTGYNRHELLGKSLLKIQLLPLDQLPKAAMLLEKNALGESTGPEEFTLIRKNGSKVTAEIRSHPVKINSKTLVLGIARDITDRKVNEEKIKESEEKYREIFEGVNDGLIYLNRKGKILEVNVKAVKIFGGNREDLIDKHFKDIGIFKAKDVPSLMRNFRSVLSGKSPIINLSIRNKKNKVLHLECSASLQKAEGRTAGIIIVVRDITERKQLEDELKARLNRLQKQEEAIIHMATYEAVVSGDIEAAAKEITKSVADAMDVERVSVWQFTKDKKTLYCEALYEKTPKKHSGGMVLETSKYPTYFKALKSGRAIDAHEACADPRTQEFQEQYLNPNGIISMLDSAIRVGGETVGVVCHEHVGTPRKWRDDEIVFAGQVADQVAQTILNNQHKKAEQLYKTIAEASPDAVTTSDLEGNITYASKRTLALHGYESTDEVIGKNALDFIVPEDHDRAIKNMQVTLEKGIVENKEYVLLRKDGSKFPGEISGALIRDIDQNPTAFIAITRDITERKIAEENMKTSLREKEVMLKEIHHRVKNNMQIVSSLIRLQSKDIIDEMALDRFKVSETYIKSMALIHESLYKSDDLARIDFSSYIKRLTTHLFSVYNHAATKISLNLDTKDVYLDINRAIPCGQIINELVSNSLKHAFPDEKLGAISVEMNKDTEGKHIVIVKDNGIGLSQKMNFRKTETLGMQLVTDLVKQINGTIQLSRTGGTAFKIVF